RRRRDRRGRRETRTRADDRPGDGRHAARRRRVRRGTRDGSRARDRPSVDPGRRRVTPASDGSPRLLIRDLPQVATPAGRSAPLRGADLGAVEVVEAAYVLCEAGRIVGVGPMRELPSVGGDLEELDGRGLAAVPGLVDCHTHACFAGDRVGEFALRAAGASYEELHAAGGGILSTVRTTRGASDEELAGALARH